MSFAVYVSYSRENEKLVNSLYSTLKQHGININVFPTDYVEDLEKQPLLSKNVQKFISESDCTLLFLTKEATKSPNVLWEASVARTLRKPIMLIVETGVEVPSNLRDLPRLVLDYNNPSPAIEQVRQLSLKLKSEKEQRGIAGVLFLLAALALIISSD